MTYKLFIDDLRDPVLNNWVIARSSVEAIKIVTERGCPKEIAFDHDLGGDDTVLNFLKYFENALLDKSITMPDTFIFSVHSANPIGRARISGHVKALVQECLGSKCHRHLEPEDFQTRLKCTKCGHVQLATPAVVTYNRGEISYTVGSAFNYCNSCDGPVEPIWELGDPN